VQVYTRASTESGSDSATRSGDPRFEERFGGLQEWAERRRRTEISITRMLPIRRRRASPSCQTGGPWRSDRRRTYPGGPSVVRVYAYRSASSKWDRLGDDDIVGTDPEGERFGNAVSLSCADGNGDCRGAIGDPAARQRGIRPGRRLGPDRRRRR